MPIDSRNSIKNFNVSHIFSLKTLVNIWVPRFRRKSGTILEMKGTLISFLIHFVPTVSAQTHFHPLTNDLSNPRPSYPHFDIESMKLWLTGKIIILLKIISPLLSEGITQNSPTAVVVPSFFTVFLLKDITRRRP